MPKAKSIDKKAVSSRRKYRWSRRILRLEPILPRSIAARMRRRMLKHAPDTKRLKLISDTVRQDPIADVDRLEVSFAANLLDSRFPDLRSIHLFSLKNYSNIRRLTIVTDSLEGRSLFGGVGTAVIAATLLAESIGASIRICTRRDETKGATFRQTLLDHNITPPENITCTRCWTDKDSLDWHEGDVVFTTSWWTTAAMLRSVSPKKIIYLLQEDERSFYPDGDDRLRCEQILNNKNIRFLINTKILYDHLLVDFPHLKESGVYFEPAFPKHLYFSGTPTNRKQLLFYARPNHVRNLFWLGLQTLDLAMLRGVFDPSLWDIVFVGIDIPPVKFSNGVEPRRLERLPWSDYAAVIRSTDLGLSLMASPHPSYPPFDLAASGAVVVTNSWKGKRSLKHICENILVASPEPDELVKELIRGKELASNRNLRLKNYQSANFERDWSATLSKSINFASSAWHG